MLLLVFCVGFFAGNSEEFYNFINDILGFEEKDNKIEYNTPVPTKLIEVPIEVTNTPTPMNNTPTPIPLVKDTPVPTFIVEITDIPPLEVTHEPENTPTPTEIVVPKEVGDRCIGVDYVYGDLKNEGEKRHYDYISGVDKMASETILYSSTDIEVSLTAMHKNVDLPVKKCEYAVVYTHDDGENMNTTDFFDYYEPFILTEEGAYTIIARFTPETGEAVYVVSGLIYIDRTKPTLPDVEGGNVYGDYLFSPSDDIKIDKLIVDDIDVSAEYFKQGGYIIKADPDGNFTVHRVRTKDAAGNICDKVYILYNEQYTVTLECNLDGEKAPFITKYKFVKGDKSSRMNLPATLKKPGYGFAGWYDNPLFIGEVVTKIPDTMNKDITYYARWEKCEGIILNGVTVISGSDIEKTEHAIDLEKPDMIYANHIFSMVVDANSENYPDIEVLPSQLFAYLVNEEETICVSLGEDNGKVIIPEDEYTLFMVFDVNGNHIVDEDDKYIDIKTRVISDTLPPVVDEYFNNLGSVIMRIDEANTSKILIRKQGEKATDVTDYLKISEEIGQYIALRKQDFDFDGEVTLEVYDKAGNVTGHRFSFK
ncbi:MAG: InlB B-repeat-containing protein [Lachnospiraceae bacterium]|nr:InlB B-repeat-containing protein [Lachnospiraceae bacterium]